MTDGRTTEQRLEDIEARLEDIELKLDVLLRGFRPPNSDLVKVRWSDGTAGFEWVREGAAQSGGGTMTNAMLRLIEENNRLLEENNRLRDENRRVRADLEWLLEWLRENGERPLEVVNGRAVDYDPDRT